MRHTFADKQAALSAGYRSPVRGQDKDVSSPNSYGYAFEDGKGNHTVPVYLTDERNKIGGRGAIEVMFPPNS